MKFEAVVKEVVKVSPKVSLVRLTFEGVSEFKFRPGQWVGVWSDDFLGENNKPVRRAFSIASVPGEPYLELCVAKGQNFSAFLHDTKPGQKFWVDGPYGMFWLRPAKKYLFIAGGTGIAPFRPMVHEAVRSGADVILIYSMKSPSDYVYRDELESVKGKFVLVPTITVKGYSQWMGRQGRVQTFLKEYFDKDRQTYVCGPPSMVEELEKDLLKLGLKKEMLFVDKWE